MLTLNLTPEQVTELETGIISESVLAVIADVKAGAETCEVCEDLFTSNRKSGFTKQLYCSPACRQKAVRARANARKRRSR